MKFLIDLNSSCFDRYLGFPRLGPSSVMNPPPPPGSCEAPSPLPLMKAPLQTGVLSPPRPGDAVGTLGLLIKVDLLEGSGGPSPPRRHSALGVRGEAVGERPRPQTPRSAAPRHRFWGPQTRQRTPHRLALPHRGPHRSGDPRAPSPMQRHLRKSPSPSAPPRPPGMPYTHHQSPMMLAGQRRMKKSPSWVRERGNILPRLGSSRESRAPSKPPGRAAGLPAASLRQPGAAGPGGPGWAGTSGRLERGEEAAPHKEEEEGQGCESICLRQGNRSPGGRTGRAGRGDSGMPSADPCTQTLGTAWARTVAAACLSPRPCCRAWHSPARAPRTALPCPACPPSARCHPSPCLVPIARAWQPCGALVSSPHWGLPGTNLALLALHQAVSAGDTRQEASPSASQHPDPLLCRVTPGVKG